MNTKYPEALTLAQKLENAPAWESQSPTIYGWNDSGETLAEAAALVRRLLSDYETLLCKLQTLEELGGVQHPDDAAVEKLAEAMKQKLAEKRAQGRSGWDTDCTQQRLSDLLRQHVEKGDVLDVANFCAFLFARGERVSAAQAQPVTVPWEAWFM